MVKKFFKKKSKRVTCSKRYKIERKVKEHGRKSQKERKKHPERFRKKLADPGIPNSLPFKDKVLEEVAAAKQHIEEVRLKKREELKQRRQEQREKITASKRSMNDATTLISDAEKRGLDFEAKQSGIRTESNSFTDRSAKAYYREFKKVVEAADVILEVLDARDPMGTRCPQMEAAVTGQPGKRLVLVLNKADLVPRPVLESWLAHLRGEHPTVVFKSSTQTQGHSLAQTSKDVLKSSADLLCSSRCLGADVLMQLLKNYCRSQGIKTAICVGVVGLPNVGKSSLINSLKRSKACGVGSTPGFTKSMQEVQLDSKVRLLDCPGIVLPGGDCSSDSGAALRNTMKVEQLSDPVKPVEAILERANKDQLMLHYRLADYNNPMEFLAQLGRRFGKLKKGGVPDVDAAARRVLMDWNSGRIKYYTQPPPKVNSELTSTLVTSLAAEFDLAGLISEETELLSALPDHRPSAMMVIDSAGPLTQIREYVEDAEEMETGQQELLKDVCVSMEHNVEVVEEPSRKPRWQTIPKDFDASKMSLKKLQKQVTRKGRKEANRNLKRTDDLADTMENFDVTEKDDYDFDVYV